MKSSKNLMIIGFVATIGVIGYEIYKHYHSTKDVHKADAQEVDNILSKQEVDSMIVSPTKFDSKISETKNVAVNSIKDRHYEAAKVMGDSLNTIFEESEESIVSENSDTLKKTSSTLDSLLK